MKKNNSPEDSGSFFSGFTIGLFAGAVGYYLFASEKGSKLVKKVSKEWEKAQKELPVKSGKSVAKTSIKEGLLGILQELVASVESVNDQVNTSENMSNTSKRARKKTSKRQFKNTD